MFKKILSFSIIVLISMSLFNVVLATDALIYSNSTSNNEMPISDNPVVNPLRDTSSNSSENIASDYQPTVTTTTDYEDSTELSISNMINIILIVVGVVLVLLGIAIIIKLK